ncbi:E3 ubiquitin-protein ligase TRIM39-like isoform X1 [Triplophysa rosa]|uniref:E3 ubiquitin-protein ligase TRIM39 n=1 Tax=Triplophysa rosa TaxID=992332 RepID=A0A9W8CCQ7_TRIRA|nr:E3 ubiquitin-protein ligase TRIM39-like isoform X1 [Triplophysa rosa]KAI7814649.1 putative E3 ubiquitin-protein ligase TRIM39 [Triplophysa rosa]
MEEFTQQVERKGSMTEPLEFKRSCSDNPVICKLQCSVCQDVFTDPVTTPCGHNFCNTCLKKWWDSSQKCKCPLCKENFPKRPDLKINIILRELAESFKSKKLQVFCDTCAEKKVKALKSCLVCQTSYCETHLEPHQKVASLSKHKLINPVENLESYICRKHERPLELFCRDDQMCVCLSCTQRDHKTHNTVPIEEESARRKAQLEKTLMDVKQKIEERNKNIQDMKDSVKLSKKSRTELLRVIEKEKAAEDQAEDLMKELEQEITELKRRDTELEQLSHTDDHLHLLQIYPSLWSPLNSRNWSEICMNAHLSMSTLCHFNKYLQELPQQQSETVLTDLKEIQKYAVDVTLDANTAHACLVLAEDLKEVRVDVSRTINELPNNPDRFDLCPSVLGKEGFSSGKIYFEVQVKGKTDWDLGVARESINRKGNISLSPRNGYWTIGLWKGNEYQASASPAFSLSLKVEPQTVGVFVDYEEGLVSFYDVESRSHIYSFTGQSFTEKLYPFFFPGKNVEDAMPLIVSSVSQNI